MTTALDSLLGNGVFFAFRAADSRLPGAMDAVLAPPRATAASMARAGLGILRLSATAWEGLLPSREGAAALRELRNKLEVFELFRYADAVLGLPGGAAAPLAERVARAGRLDPYAALWVTEGVGYSLAEQTATAGGLLRGLAASGVPARAWLPLHTGMGLSLAGRAHRQFDLRGSPAQGLRWFADLCAESSMPGYGMAAFEALGFVSRNLHPESVAAIDRELSSAELSYFWHGVGRGLLFSPARAFPGSSSQAIEEAQGVPCAVRRRQAVAGVAWALTLVNVRHRGILDVLLARCRRRLSATGAEAFANGVCSALAIWSDASGGSTSPAELCRSLPRGLLEDDNVKRVCRETFERHRRLKRDGRLEELFFFPNGG